MYYIVALKEEEYSEDPIFLWANDNGEQTLSLKQLHEAVYPAHSRWAEMMKSACEPIVAVQGSQVVLTGEGLELAGMNDIIGEIGEIIVYDATHFYYDSKYYIVTSEKNFSELF